MPLGGDERDKPSRNVLTILLPFKAKEYVGPNNTKVELSATGVPAKISKTNIGDM